MTDATATHPPVTDHPTSVTTVPFEPIVGAHLEHTAEPQRVRWTFAAFDIASAWTTSWLDYVNGALERRVTPLDMIRDAQRFWSTATARPRPTWSTSYEVVKEWPAVRLLDFSTTTDAEVVPTVFLPPQAGHASTIVDYTPEQSQVRTALERGLTRLFVLDWLGATPQTTDTTIEDYVAVLDEVVERVGGRVNLVGDCQGGWLATIYAALRPQSVASLTIGAAPIDFHAGDGAIHDWVTAQRDTKDPMWIYRSLVDSSGGMHKGEFQVTGFKMLEPAGEMNRLADLWANIDDPEYVERYLDFVAWFETPQDMAGAFYLWTVEHLFVNNELVTGDLRVGGEKVDLARITMPVHLLAGSNDHITPPEQVWALAEHVSTPKEDIDSHLVEAGHLGLFMGRRALKDHWGPLFSSVKERNARRAKVEEKEPVAKAAPVKTAETTVPATKKPATKTRTPRKAAPATKAAPAKKAPATKAAPATTVKTEAPAPKKTTTKTAPAKAPATKAAPAKKAPATKAAPVKKSETATPATTSAPATTVKTEAPAAKEATTKAAPAKKAPATKAAPATTVKTEAPAAKKPTAKAAPTKKAPATKPAAAQKAEATAPATKPAATKQVEPASATTAPVEKSAPAVTPASKSAPASTTTEQPQGGDPKTPKA